MRTMQSSHSAVAKVFAFGNAIIAVAVVIAAALYEAPSRLIVVPSVLLALLLLWSSFGLLRSTRWRLVALRACAWVGLGIGATAVAALAIAAGRWSAARGGLESLEGLEGSVLSPMLGLALLLPYLLLYPCVQLLWADRQKRYAE
jgi:hypothetical protein